MSSSPAARLAGTISRKPGPRPWRALRAGEAGDVGRRRGITGGCHRKPLHLRVQSGRRGGNDLKRFLHFAAERSLSVLAEQLERFCCAGASRGSLEIGEEQALDAEGDLPPLVGGRTGNRFRIEQDIENRLTADGFEIGSLSAERVQRAAQIFILQADDRRSRAFGLRHQMKDGRVGNVGREAEPQHVEQRRRRMRCEARQTLEPFDIVERDPAFARHARPDFSAGIAVDARQSLRGARQTQARSSARRRAAVASNSGGHRRTSDTGVSQVLRRRSPELAHPGLIGVAVKGCSEARTAADDEKRRVGSGAEHRLDCARGAMRPIGEPREIAVEVHPLERDALTPEISQEPLDLGVPQPHFLAHVLQHENRLGDAPRLVDQRRHQPAAQRRPQRPTARRVRGPACSC